MNVSREVSGDIVKYLQNKKGQSISDIAKSMDTSPSHIQNVINKKENLRSNDINAYLKNNNIHLWQFAIKAIKIEHLSPKAKKKVLLCKELSEHIKKKKI